jgi:hypothetical protein
MGPITGGLQPRHKNMIKFPDKVDQIYDTAAQPDRASRMGKKLWPTRRIACYARQSDELGLRPAWMIWIATF